MTWGRFPLRAFRVLTAVVLGGTAVAVVILTYRWPLIGDAQVFHYQHFLMTHGFVLYRDIPDINMPGCHLIENLAFHLFGGSDLSWRMYDFTLLGILTLSMIVIARGYDWLAGFFAGMLFTLQHLRNGAWNAVERDEIMTVLIMVSYAFLFESLRQRRPWLLFGFGLSLGIASSVKPPVAPLGIALLLMAAVLLRKRKQPTLPYVTWAVAGAALAIGYVLAFLVERHVVGDFLYDMRTYTWGYAGIDRANLSWMLRHALPRGIWALLPFGLLAGWLCRKTLQWEQWAIALGALFGFLSYLAQGKGFTQHTYPLVAPLLLWMSIELAVAMRDSEVRVRLVGVAGFAVGIFFLVPVYLYLLRQAVPPNAFIVHLESDLTHMGGPRLDHRVECLDTIYGCYIALYHLRLIQNNAMIGDLLLFSETNSPAVEQYRDRFWNALMHDPPAVIVLSNQVFYRKPGFDKIHEWPPFASYLRDNYRLAVTRSFPDQQEQAYRIYVRNGVALPLPVRSAGSS